MYDESGDNGDEDYDGDDDGTKCVMRVVVVIMVMQIINDGSKCACDDGD